MISVWLNDLGPHGVNNYFAGRGAAIRERFSLRTYSPWEPGLEVWGGAHLFTGLDQLTPAGREGVAALWDQLAALPPGGPLLNDPRRTLLRGDLLTRLAERGLNRFRVWPGTAPDAVTRFPVFVREESNHTGNLTTLLDSRPALLRALRGLRMRGLEPARLLVVEYCHTADAEGVFRKYAAFKVGPTIIPCHLLSGRCWMMKSEGDLKTVALAREELAYVTENPHAAWLEQVFALSGADFGRLDYGVLAGVPQAWELNLNPTLGRPPGKPPKPLAPEVAEVREASRELFHRRLREALLALDPDTTRETLPLTLHPALVKRIAQESARIHRRAAVVARLAAAYERLPLRSVLGRVLPRL